MSKCPSALLICHCHAQAFLGVGKEEEKQDEFVKVDTPASKQREAEKKAPPPTNPATKPASQAPGRTVPSMPNEKTPSATAPGQGASVIPPHVPPRPAGNTTSTPAAQPPPVVPPRPEEESGEAQKEEIQKAAYKACE